MKYQTSGLTNGDSSMYLLLAPILLRPGKIKFYVMLCYVMTKITTREKLKYFTVVTRVYISIKNNSCFEKFGES